MANKLVAIMVAYVKSMRPYTFFVTGTAGILGLLLVPATGGAWRTAVILILLFSSYGINQVINDLLGAKEDRLNAPLRPLVSGELDRKTALWITVFLFIASVAAVYCLNPYALVFCFLAYGANIVYEQFKGVPMLGNVWFGLMIALAPMFSALAASPSHTFGILYDRNLIGLAVLVAASSSALCYYTYFKDYAGDKMAGKKTIIVALGLTKARYLNLPMSMLPFLLLLVFVVSGVLTFPTNPVFLALVSASCVFSLYAAFFSFNHPEDDKKALELNFECAPLFFSALAALFSPALGIFLFAASFAVVRLSYRLMYRKLFY